MPGVRRGPLGLDARLAILNRAMLGRAGGNDGENRHRRGTHRAASRSLSRHGSDVFEFEEPFGFTAKRKLGSGALLRSVTPSELIASYA